MIVLGDSIPHDANLNADFPDCPATQLTDPGSAFTMGDAQYPAVGPLHTIDVLKALQQHNTNVSFVTYNPQSINSFGSDSSFSVAGCHTDLAQFTGGSEVGAAGPTRARSGRRS